MNRVSFLWLSGPHKGGYIAAIKFLFKIPLSPYLPAKTASWLGFAKLLLPRSLRRPRSWGLSGKQTGGRLSQPIP